MSTNTVKLHRVLRAPPARVYKAFLDPDAMAKWLPPHGFTGKVHHLDAKVGGTYRMSFTNFNSGNSHSFGGSYLELVPGERIRHTDKFDDPNLPGEMQTTITLKKVFCGTDVSIVQEGIPAAIPAEACYLGWQESLVLLGQLVEAEIRVNEKGKSMFALLMGLKTISPEDLHRLAGTAHVSVIDVNSEQSWMKAHVPGAKHLDPAEYKESELPADKSDMLVFYCSNPMCRKAPNAARRATKLGYGNVRVMSAGISGWLAKDLPTETEP